MKKYAVGGLWACLYVVCACLGLVEDPAGFGLVLCILLSAAFFIPGALLLFWSYREDDRLLRLGIRWTSLGVLAASLVLLVANFLSAQLPLWAGRLLHVALVLVSTPMVCSRRWGLILFFWACLLLSTFLKRKK